MVRYIIEPAIEGGYQLRFINEDNVRNSTLSFHDTEVEAFNTAVQKLQAFLTGQLIQIELMLETLRPKQYTNTFTPALAGSILGRIKSVLEKLKGNKDIDKLFTELREAISALKIGVQDPKISRIMENLCKMERNLHGANQPQLF